MTVITIVHQPTTVTLNSYHCHVYLYYLTPELIRENTTMAARGSIRKKKTAFDIWKNVEHGNPL